MKQRDYDSTVARIAGNLLSGHPSITNGLEIHGDDIKAAVASARAIVEETRRTEPKADERQ